MAVTPCWDYRRVIAATHILIEVATEKGLDYSDCLRGTSITVEDLKDTTTEIEASEELTVIRNVLARLGDHPGFGTEVGSKFALGNYGLFGFAMLSSPTVRAAIEFGCRYIQLANMFSNVTFEESGEQGLIRFDSSDTPADVRDFLIERELATIRAIAPSLLKKITDELFSQCQLDLVLSKERGSGIRLPASLSVRYDQPHTVLRFPRRVLDRRPPQAHAPTAELLEAQCQDLLRARTRRRELADRVRSRLKRDLGRIPSMAEVATELHIDPRTLRRRLRDEGTSFRALTEEARAALSPGLLEMGLRVEEVAKRLGYTEASSFSRAFTRWHGIPPSQYVRPRGFQYDPC
ncbi:AraC family transcriptional regulator [Mycobacteroides abscessus]|uniref:AraC family transcriptional regulator n=1 Tax=Mycobacteroides abscessus TaxID=36809 RepID=UPI000E68A47E|nr:AraC family transcriptional regulator [Mycobacteroides abscessus]RIS72850.1 AraC family transcriptional regulator [Mycobacteroides abscessus]